MKHEPTAATLIGIYKLLHMELDDLSATDIQDTDQAFRLLCESADEIRDEMGNVFQAMQNAGEIMKGGAPDPAENHRQFTEIYRAAIQIAGKSVRLAAIARQGIIQSETMNPIDRMSGQEGGGYGKTD